MRADAKTASYDNAIMPAKIGAQKDRKSLPEVLTARRLAEFFRVANSCSPGSKQSWRFETWRSITERRERVASRKFPAGVYALYITAGKGMTGASESVFLFSVS
jgi:hypothetical protein